MRSKCVFNGILAVIASKMWNEAVNSFGADTKLSILRISAVCSKSENDIRLDINKN